jgi:hypothetical protein
MLTRLPTRYAAIRTLPIPLGLPMMHDDPFELATKNRWLVCTRGHARRAVGVKRRGGPVEAIQTRHPALQFS